MPNQIRTFRDVIDLWPARAAMARDLSAAGTPTGDWVVRSWHRHDRIPYDQFSTVARVAQGRGWTEVTYRLLADLWKARKASGPPAPANAGQETDHGR